MAVIKAETEKQKEQAIKKWEKTNKPNPFSYKTDKCDEVISTAQRKHKDYSFSKEARKTLIGKSLSSESKSDV